VLLDLTYAEDASADVDMNVVMTGSGGFVEVQGTAEREPFTAADLTALTRLAKSGITKLMTYQQRVLGPRLIA
jgi:ribonuclease PH